MKAQMIVPGMIFSLVDRRPVTITPDRTLPTHFYLVISTGSEACLQDIQCMSISSMQGKNITYELPVIVQDTVSYVLPYNIVSFRKDDVKMEYYRGLLIGDKAVAETSEFLQLCRDIYMDALYGDIDASLKTRITDYQKKFESAFSHVPKYERKSFKNSTVIETAECDFNTVSDVVEDDPQIFKATLDRIDSLPGRYAAWTDDDVFTALLFWGNNDLLHIISQSHRFNSLGTLKNVRRQMQRRVHEMNKPQYHIIINGREYSFDFKTGKCCYNTSLASADRAEVKATEARIINAMKG